MGEAITGYIPDDTCACYKGKNGYCTHIGNELFARLENETVRIEIASASTIWLDQDEIIAKRHRRIITEGTLMGDLLAQGISVNFSIVSDDAGQFNVFDHALSLIHAERIIN